MYKLVSTENIKIPLPKKKSTSTCIIQKSEYASRMKGNSKNRHKKQGRERRRMRVAESYLK